MKIAGKITNVEQIDFQKNPTTLENMSTYLVLLQNNSQCYLYLNDKDIRPNVNDELIAICDSDGNAFNYGITTN